MWNKSNRTEAVVQRCSVKRVFLEISQNPQENTCASLIFDKVAGLRSATLLKKRPWHRCFPVNFAKFLRTPFLTEHLRWLLLKERGWFIQAVFHEENAIARSVTIRVVWVSHRTDIKIYQEGTRSHAVILLLLSRYLIKWVGRPIKLVG